MARNNQDAVAVQVRGHRTVAVVADGCSMGASSEVGAALGAAWMAARVVGAAVDWRDRAAVVTELRAIARDFDAVLASWLAALGDGEDAPELAARYFLFGFLCAVVDGDHGVIFGLGDGLYAVGARIEVIDPGPDNAPPYAAYRVLPAATFDGPPPRAELTVHFAGPLAGGEALVIATDGAVPIASELLHWLADPGTWITKQALNRRLNLAERYLPDDTTIVALKRSEASCA